MQNETAVFGGGCFWCTEAIFQQLKGVVSVMPGYAGGKVAHPTYEHVSNGTTGHAEVIKIEFDPSIISYTDLLAVFFGTHDGTTLNRQGNDRGTQYRSIILYTNDEQKHAAEKFIHELNANEFKETPIVTELQPLKQFYEAEDYHRKYYFNNSNKPYCQIVIGPKVQKLKKRYTQLLKP